MDHCTVCRREVHGGFFVITKQTLRDETAFVAIEGTPDRDFNVCDLCNDVICFNCSVKKDSGYCNACYSKVLGLSDQQQKTK
jgi:hypothetical protein